MVKKSFRELNQRIIHCKRCPRLATYIQTIAKTKVKRFQNESYWGKPLPGFGDPKAKLLLIGLAPAAHGGNRTGRMFTGDSSGDWVAKVLYKYGFATREHSKKLNDGFNLIDAYITASVRCAPPKNKPLREEFENCFPYLVEEFELLKNAGVIICLGKTAFDSCRKLLEIKNIKFEHGKLFTHKKWHIVCTYHPSKQNTQTGRLSWSAWSNVFAKAKKVLEEKN